MVVRVGIEAYTTIWVTSTCEWKSDFIMQLNGIDQYLYTSLKSKQLQSNSDFDNANIRYSREQQSNMYAFDTNKRNREGLLYYCVDKLVL